MPSFRPKIINCEPYHVWTDALHLRALAMQAENDWDRGTYVRTTIIIAWTAFETSCSDALGRQIGSRVQEEINDALKGRGLEPTDWGRGLWQQVGRIKQLRVAYAHRGILPEDRLPPVSQADEAIRVLREAIQDIHTRVGKRVPEWVEDDYDPGWPDSHMGRGGSLCQTVGTGYDPGGPDTVRVTFLLKQHEYSVFILPPGSDPAPYMERVVLNARGPMNEVRAYCGHEITQRQFVIMRGT